MKNNGHLGSESGLPAPNVFAVTVSDKNLRLKVGDQLRELPQRSAFWCAVHPRDTEFGRSNLSLHRRGKWYALPTKNEQRFVLLVAEIAAGEIDRDFGRARAAAGNEVKHAVHVSEEFSAD
jgi:hypothetical protein